jgi:transglutaminase-like putative cysteine protease
MARRRSYGNHGAVIRSVSSRAVLDIRSPARIIAQIAVADPAPATVVERLSVTIDGMPAAFREVATAHGGRLHMIDAKVGKLELNYAATVTGTAAPAAVDEADIAVYLRPSRYAESDKIAGFALRQFGDVRESGDQVALLAAVFWWVRARMAYVPGSSGPTDSAVDTLMTAEGVCRDYSHLTVALLRALDVPARVVAVYAPGLSPMDFHAVAEALVDGAWRVVDATALAPRQSLLRIATGRDAADTAFLSDYMGTTEFVSYEVSAIVEGYLPYDDINALVELS